MNRNGTATLKLGYARGDRAAGAGPGRASRSAEYGAKTVKLAVVGTGGCRARSRCSMMVRRLLPGATLRRADAADALAVAICHAHHRQSNLRIASWTRMA